MKNTASQSILRPWRSRFSLFLICLWALNATSAAQEQGAVPGSEPKAEATGEEQAELVSQETITSSRSEVKILEDGTVADALQRRPDLRFANVTVDGQKSDVSLASMSSAAVGKVEVLKAVTPDVDADSVGGSISVRSKPAFEQAGRTIQGRFVFGMDSGIQELVTKGTVTLGKAFGPDMDWGALFTIRGENDHGGSDNHSIKWISLDEDSGDLRVINRMKLSQWRDDGQELELTGVLDHRINQNLSLFVRGNYARENNAIHEPEIEVRFGVGTYVEADDDGAVVEGARVERRMMAFESKGEEWTASTGGYFETDNIDADFRFSYKEASTLTPDFYEVTFEQTDMDLSYDLADRNFPTFQQLNGDTLYDADKFTFQEMISEVRSQDETDLTGTMNMLVKHGLGLPGTGFWKVGAKIRIRDVDQKSDSLLHDDFIGDYRQSDVVSDYRDENFWDGRYRIDPGIDLPEALDFRNTHSDRFVLNERRSREDSDPATYDAAEQTTSGYAMASFETGGLRILAGGRYEQTDIHYTGREVVIDANGEYESTQIRTGSSSYGNFFPSIHARYRFTDKIILIGSWTETINRPPFRDLVPYRFVDIADKDLEEGNPDLDPALLSNYDLALDIATPRSGLLSLEAFSKSIRDFYFTQESIMPDGPYAGFIRYRKENGPTASITGAEITWRQELSILHSALSSFAFSLNYLWRNTSITYPSRPDETLPLAGLPNEVLKFTFLMEKAWFFGQIELTQRSDQLGRVGDTPEQDYYTKGRTQVNIDTTWEVMTGVKLIAELHNITGAYARQSYEADPRYSTRLRSGTWNANLGVRWDL